MSYVPKVVKFTHSWGAYTVGEVAGFSERQARLLIDSGIAQPYSSPKTAGRKKIGEDKQFETEGGTDYVTK